jgi:hypothetical protein
MGADWASIRAHKLANERPEGWPEGVRAISLEGLRLFGIDERTGKLYWDGEEIVTKVGLKTFERALALIATVSGFGIFVLQLGKAASWWN